MSSVFGLKEIRFINSGDFIHEIVDVSTSTLLLGSSGVGKTTIMSAACYFYTMDKDKTRPDVQDQTFYEWHLISPFSHIIYRYSNSIGDNLLILSFEEGKPKHSFINIHNFTENIDTLYLDTDGNTLELKEILEKCTINDLPFHKTETFTLFKKLLHKQEYRTLREKDKPVVDFSIFRDAESSKVFSEHLFKIYKSSSIHDSTIKNMLISLIDTNENKFDITDFKLKLEQSLQSVEQIEILKKKRDEIIDLDKVIDSYKVLLTKQDKLIDSIFEVKNNQRTIEQFISGNIDTFEKEYDDLSTKIDSTSKLRKETIDKYNESISKASLAIEQLEDQDNTFRKNGIKEKILEQGREQDYRLEEETLRARFNALNSDLKELKSKEDEQKRNAKLSLHEMKSQEKDKLDSAINEGNKNLVSLIESFKDKLESQTSKLEKEKEDINIIINELGQKIVTLETELKFLPKQEIKNDVINILKKTIDDLNGHVTDTKSKISEKETSLKTKKEELKTSQKELSSQRESEVLTYNDDKNKIDEQISQINLKLNFDKHNLYGFINKINHPFKKEIFAVTKDEILFQEDIDFERADGENLYGIKVNADINDFTNQYDVQRLETKKKALLESRDVLVAEHNKSINKIDEKTRELEKNCTKELKELSREKYKFESALTKYTNDLASKSQELQEEIEFEREKRQKQILSLKGVLDTKSAESTTLKKNERNLSNRVSGIKKELDDDLKVKKENISKKIQENEESLSHLNKKYEKLIEERFEQIEKEYKKVLEEKNIDQNELNSLDKKLKNINKKLDDIARNKPTIMEYERLKPDIDNIPNKKEELEKLKSSKKEEDDSFEEQINSLSTANQKAKENVKRWERNLEEFNQFIEYIVTIPYTSDVVGDVYSDEDIDIYLERKHFTELINDYNKNKENTKNRIQDIRNKTESLTRGIPQDNILKLRTCAMDIVDSESVESYISIARDYIIYIKEELDIQGASLQLRALSETIHAAVSQIKHIEEDVNIISSEVTKINNMLKIGVSKIKVIDLIHLKYSAYTSNELLNQIKRVGELLDKEYGTLFNNDDIAEKAKDKILEQARYLKNLFSQDFKQTFSISDMSRLSFDVSENGKMHSSLATLNTIGSNGTTIMVKTIIYLTLLKKVSAKFDSELKLHCILDEIAQISADYFVEVLRYANDLGFSFLNGTAANDDDIISCYTNIYTGVRNGNKTDVHRYIVEDIFEEDIVDAINE